MEVWWMVEMRILQHNSLTPWPLEDGSVQAVVTSPPYFMQRLYTVPDIEINGWFGQYGNEESLKRYLYHTELWLKEAYRVLKPDGSVFVVIGDKRAGSGVGTEKNPFYKTFNTYYSMGFKPTSLMLIPERMAILMQAMGFIIKNKIVWKRTMPESVKSRFTDNYELIIFATKTSKNYFNLDAVRELIKPATIERYKRPFHKGKDFKAHGGSMNVQAQRRIAEKIQKAITKIPQELAETMGSPRVRYHREQDTKYNKQGKKPEEMKILDGGGHVEHGGINAKDSIYRDKVTQGVESAFKKNPGDVWLDYYLETAREILKTEGIESYLAYLKSEISDIFPPLIKNNPFNHYAPFSERLVERLILCSTRIGDMVVDPFCGSGTTGKVAIELQREFSGFDLGYQDIAEKRLTNIQRRL
jgi:DNA modification methylase